MVGHDALVVGENPRTCGLLEFTGWVGDCGRKRVLDLGAVPDVRSCLLKLLLLSAGCSVFTAWGGSRVACSLVSGSMSVCLQGGFSRLC